jgi:hypothetical protein
MLEARVGAKKGEVGPMQKLRSVAFALAAAAVVLLSQTAQVAQAGYRYP